MVAIMCVYFSVNILGCLTDGKRAELMHKNPQTGGDLVAYSVAGGCGADVGFSGGIYSFTK